VGLVAHGQSSIIFICRDAQESSMRQRHSFQDVWSVLPCFSKLLPHIIREFILSICLCRKFLGDLSSWENISFV